MTGTTAAVEAQLRALSAERAELLRLLIEEKSRRAQEIKPYPRDQDSDRARLPASWAQQRLWFIDQLEGGRRAYFIRLGMRLRGALDRESLRRALDTLLQRHEALRTVFVGTEGELSQEITSESCFALNVVDLSGHTEEEREAQVRFQQREEANSLFNLSLGPLIRGRLLQVTNEEHALFITMHHIISDGWSRDLLLRELEELYRAYRDGRPNPLRPLPIQYSDYSKWQREWLQEPLLERQLNYWRTRLSGSPPQLELPTDCPRPAVQSHRGVLSRVVLDPTLSANLKALARRHDVTLFMVLYAAWAILLSRLSGQDDVVIGTPIANRPRPELEGLIGFFVNTLVLRARVRSEQKLEEFIRHIKEVTLGAYDHQDVPFEQVVEALHPPRNLSRHPLFQAMFVLQSTPIRELHLPQLSVTLEDEIEESSKFDLLLSLEEQRNEITGIVNFATDLFDLETIDRWMACFTVLLNEMASETPGRLGELSIISEPERHQVVEAFNATEADYPQDKLIHQLFESQVERAPEAVAVVCDAQSFTYAELNAKANQLAHYLRGKGLLSGEYVPIVMPRSVKMLVAQLAVLKSDCVYVPIDPKLPRERQVFLILDCGASWVLAEHGVYEEPSLRSLHWIDCVVVAEAIAQSSSANLHLTSEAPPCAHAMPAYLMYTSGSTGIPKGVIVPHRAVNRLVINNDYARVEPTDCVAHCSNPAFDASTFEVWGALLNGARMLVVPDSVVLGPKRFAACLKEQGVTVLWMTVGLFVQYTEALTSVFPQLRYLLTGGDVVDPESVRWVMRHGPPQHFINAYGPTECTTFSTTYLIEGIADDTTSLPIGRPISNTRVYILDPQIQPVPTGVVGELYIGGKGVALGYLNRPELTAQHFIADPFSADPRALMYKTGDLGRWRADGAIEYMGRNDCQVKIRGFRIELGEIESLLARHPQVKEAVVVARQDVPGEKRLVAYWSPSDLTASEPNPSVDALRMYMSQALPDYMMPSAFVLLERIPLTPNGKPDRKGLPAPDLRAYVDRQYEPPQGDVEAKLAMVWQELLHLERVGRQDSFFELGGHSLLGLKLLFKINHLFSCALSVTDLYKSPTLLDMADRICGEATVEEQVDLSQEAVLSSLIVARGGLPRSPARAILLTGCTGFVGRFLLARLLQETGATIYCLVRARLSQEALPRLKAILLKWDLWRDEFEGRIAVISGDLKLPRLGVEAAVYRGLCEDIDTIYHCATSMNHLETYAMAKPTNVEGARELLKIATTGTPKLINHISTLSVFSAPAGDTLRVVNEETSIDNEQHSTSNGYAASKWVSEKLFMISMERGVRCNIFRLGLIFADTQQGRYDELQREYRIFKSCLLTGLGIRDYKHEMVPTPVDYSARAVVHLANQHSEGGKVFHVTASIQMLEGLFERSNEICETSLNLLPLFDWISEIKRLHNMGRSLPAVPLIEYAFSMDESSFYAYQRSMRSDLIRFDAARTHAELERAGIVAPSFDDDLLKTYIESMFLRDKELREKPERIKRRYG
jgi:myxalamid-type nonribosomal peptide synthetase MxaA